MVRELGGEVTADLRAGRGHDAQIRLPLTLAIMSALLVEVDGRPFAIPLDRVERTLRLADHAVRSVAGQRMLVMRRRRAADRRRRRARSAALRRRTPTHAVIVRGGDAAPRARRGPARRPARAGHPPAAARGRRPAPPSPARAVLSNGDIALIVDCDALDRPTPLPDRRLSRQKGPLRDHRTRTSSSTRCASWPTSARAPPHRAVEHARPPGRHHRPERAARCRSPRRSRPSATGRGRGHRRRASASSATSTATVLLLVHAAADADRCARSSASSPAREIAVSALGEIGNILGTSYINALGADDRHGAGARAAADRHRHARRDRRDGAAAPRGDDRRRR